MSKINKKLKPPRDYDEVMSLVHKDYRYQKKIMTCNKCEDVNTCKFAWDPYNTNGDCLASK